MKLISEDEFNRLNSHDLHKPPVEVEKISYSNKQQAAEDILEDNEIPDDIKSVMYSQLLKKLIDKIDVHITKNSEHKVNSPQLEQKVNKANPHSSENNITKNYELSTEDINLLKGLPFAHRPKAEHVIKILKQRPDLITWNALGVCTINGKLEPESKLVDLLNYTLTSTKWRLLPVGINRFLAICKELNVPSSVVSSKLKHEFLRQNIKPRGKRLSSERAENQHVKTFGWQSYASEHDDEDEAFATPTDNENESVN